MNAPIRSQITLSVVIPPAWWYSNPISAIPAKKPPTWAKNATPPPDRPTLMPPLSICITNHNPSTIPAGMYIMRV